MKTLLISSINTAIDLGIKNSNPYRTVDYVQQKIGEEISEIAEELEKKLKGEACGKDGIKGEIIDTLISVIDFYILLKYTNKENIYPLLDDMIQLFELSDLSSAFELDNTDSQVVNLLGLISKGANFSVFTQIHNGLSYKSAKNFGFENMDQVLNEICKSMISSCLKNYKLEVLMNGEFKNDEVLFEDFSDTWLNKMSKWREKRDL